MKIKVLRIINRFNLGGPTYNATYLSAFLSDEFETKLIGGRHEKHEGESTFIPDSYNVIYQLIDELQREINPLKDRAALQKIRQIIREFKPDIVHTHASKAGFLGRKAAIKENVPVIVHTFHGHIFHSYFGKFKTQVFKNIERKLAKKSSAIVTISALQRKELVDDLKIIPAEKAHVIKLGFDLSRFQEDNSSKREMFRTKYDLDKEAVCVGIIGRLTAIKNHKMFIEVVDLIADKIQKDVQFIIIGDGEEKVEIERLCKQVEEKYKRSLFKFTSWIKEIDIALAGLDVVALTSLNEGTPVSLIEAQAAGVPVVTTNVGGVRDVVEDGVTGYVIDDIEPLKFAKKLELLINSKEKREKMSQNGWNHVREEFSYTRLCLETENLYKELLAKKGLKK